MTSYADNMAFDLTGEMTFGNFWNVIKLLFLKSVSWVTYYSNQEWASDMVLGLEIKLQRYSQFLCWFCEWLSNSLLALREVRGRIMIQMLWPQEFCPLTSLGSEM